MKEGIDESVQCNSHSRFNLNKNEEVRNDKMLGFVGNYFTYNIYDFPWF